MTRKRRFHLATAPIGSRRARAAPAPALSHKGNGPSVRLDLGALPQ